MMSKLSALAQRAAHFFARPRYRLYQPLQEEAIVELLPGLTYYPPSKHGKARLEIDHDLEIVGLENLGIYTHKHLFLTSSGKPEEGRPAYKYSIWENARHFDEQGRPLQLVPIYDSADNQGFIPLPLTPDGQAHVDALGLPVVPEGYYAEPSYVRQQRTTQTSCCAHDHT